VKAIRALGELLAAQGDAAGIIVVGGAAMILGGFATRLTEDVDIIAVASGVWDEEVEALSSPGEQMFYPPSQTHIPALSSPPWQVPWHFDRLWGLPSLVGPTRPGTA
jgi:hypothetical protein